MKKFSIRDLFWFVFVTALALGWWLDHQQHRISWLQQVESANKQVRQFSHELHIHHDKQGESVRVVRIVR